MFSDIATVVGFYAVSIPFLTKGHPITGMDNNERFRLYYTYGRMLVKLAEAIGRLVLAGRELTRLAGFTARVTELREVLTDLNQGKYQRTMLAANTNEIALKPNSGKTVIADNVIRFDKVPLVTPNGDILVKELTFEVRSGQNVLVCGPNGCGKSSLFRILGELWPLFGGTLTKPPRGKLFYIPQRPYMTLGTLRDQLIYPHTHSDMKKQGLTDDKLIEYLGRVQLAYLVEREGGLNAVADWLDVLSGGEKQRVAVSILIIFMKLFDVVI